MLFPMTACYPDEVFDFPVMEIADVINIELGETLLTNDASQTHALYALAVVLAWRLQTFPMTERAVLHAGLAELIRVNALGRSGGH